MTRLTPLTHERLDPEQRQLFDAITSGKRSTGRPLEDFLYRDGSLRGPFNAWLHAPAVGEPAQRLGEAIRFESSLPPNLRELAILTVAAHWRADYEWWAHSRIAQNAGLSEDIISAIKGRTLPGSADTGEQCVHRFARELIESKQVSDQTYHQAVALLGEPGTVELVTLLGYYTTVSMVLKAFEVPLPAGEQSPFGAA